MTGKPDWLTVAVFHWAILTASTRARPPPTRSGTVRHHPQRLPRRNRRRARGERTFSVRPNACPTPADARRARVEPDDLAPRVRIDHRRRGARSRVLAFPARPAPRSSSHGLESLSRRRRALCCLARSVVVGMMGRGGGAGGGYPPPCNARARFAEMCAARIATLTRSGSNPGAWRGHAASRDEPGAEPCAPLDDSTRFGFESRRVAWPRGWSRNGKTVRGREVGRIGGLEVNKRARNFSARETFGLGMFVLCETLGIGSCPFDSSDSLRKPK